MPSTNEQMHFSIAYDHRFVTLKLTNYLRSIVPRDKVTHIITCIGTDRSTGDSLGPLTGSLLKRRYLKKLHVYGTLHEPVHALNLVDHLHEINNNFKNPFIIAVDASLGAQTSIGRIYSGRGPLKPGSALQKELPDIGHAHVSATVNLNSDMNYMILQNTRLSIVYDMANVIAQAIYRIDLTLREHDPPNKAPRFLQ